MKGRFAFRMKQKNKKRPTLTNCTAKWKAGWERSPYRTGLRPIIPANREKYREIYKNRPVAA
jgi:hypothetical protein